MNVYCDDPLVGFDIRKIYSPSQRYVEEKGYRAVTLNKG